MNRVQILSVVMIGVIVAVGMFSLGYNVRMRLEPQELYSGLPELLTTQEMINAPSGLIPIKSLTTKAEEIIEKADAMEEVERIAKGGYEVSVLKVAPTPYYDAPPYTFRWCYEVTNHSVVDGWLHMALLDDSEESIKLLGADEKIDEISVDKKHCNCTEQNAVAW